MKNVGLYGVLIQNSIQKTSWKQFGFLKFDEQMNLIFAVMLYIMEQSLREENCTMDDIGAYIIHSTVLFPQRLLHNIKHYCKNKIHLFIKFQKAKLFPGCLLNTVLDKNTVQAYIFHSFWKVFQKFVLQSCLP